MTPQTVDQRSSRQVIHGPWRLHWKNAEWCLHRRRRHVNRALFPSLLGRELTSRFNQHRIPRKILSVQSKSAENISKNKQAICNVGKKFNQKPSNNYNKANLINTDTTTSTAKRPRRGSKSQPVLHINTPQAHNTVTSSARSSIPTMPSDKLSLCWACHEPSH